MCHNIRDCDRNQSSLFAAKPAGPASGRGFGDAAFRMIAANPVSDHATIVRFRKESEEVLGKLFDRVLALCAEGGLMKWGAESRNRL